MNRSSSRFSEISEILFMEIENWAVVDALVVTFVTGFDGSIVTPMG
jgi:hypothetical protein